MITRSFQLTMKQLEQSFDNVIHLYTNYRLMNLQLWIMECHSLLCEKKSVWSDSCWWCDDCMELGWCSSFAVICESATAHMLFEVDLCVWHFFQSLHSIFYVTSFWRFSLFSFSSLRRVGCMLHLVGDQLLLHVIIWTRCNECLLSSNMTQHL